MLPNHQLPLVSVLIPTYNRANSLPQAINSVLAQNYPNLEIVISDNASSDQTERVVNALMTEEPCIKYYRQPENIGLGRNFNFVLHKATGKYCVFVSSDDQLGAGAIYRYVAFMEQNPDYSLVSGNINYWQDGALSAQEPALAFEEPAPLWRALKFYATVSMGSIFHGMMRRELAQKHQIYSRLGDSWHFVAGLAFQGKIKKLDFVGYNKQNGGVSHDFHNHAKNLGERKIWGYFTSIKVALDAIKDIGWRDPVYQSLGPVARIGAGLAAAILLLAHQELVIAPRVWAGKLLRMLRIKTLKERQLQKLTTTATERRTDQANQSWITENTQI